MKERPIPFTGASVRSTLDGRKRQTRRVVRLRRRWEMGERADGGLWPYYPEYVTGEPECVAAACPYGKPGDRLWVRETWAPSVIDPEGGCFEEDPSNFDIVYRADGDDAYWAAHWTRETVVRGRAVSTPCRPKWRSPRFMPRWASRLTLAVTDVRVERLQDITVADAESEGLIAVEGDGGAAGPGFKWQGIGYHGAGFNAAGAMTFHVPDKNGRCSCRVGGRSPAQCAYRELWDSLNAKRGYGWDTNTSVWVIAFQRIDVASEVRHG